MNFGSFVAPGEKVIGFCAEIDFYLECSFLDGKYIGV